MRCAVATALVLVLTACPDFPLSLLGDDAGVDIPDIPDTAPSDAVSVETVASDTSQPDTTPDARPPDLTRPPDTTLADTRPPDTTQPDLVPPYYVNEPFTSTMGKVTPATGSWSLASGALRQSDNSYNGYYATADVPVSDYLAETRLTIENLPPDPWLQGAGLGVRVQPGAVGQHPPAMYVCVISPDGNWIGIVKCPGGPTYDCGQPPVKKTVPIQLNVAYRITMKAQGSTLTCSLPDLGHSVVLNDGSYASGGVALATFQTRTRFDYLKVGPP